MEPKYHVRTDGTIGKCSAEVKPCPFGGVHGDKAHMESIESWLREQNAVKTSLKKKQKNQRTTSLAKTVNKGEAGEVLANLDLVLGMIDSKGDIGLTDSNERGILVKGVQYKGDGTKNLVPWARIIYNDGRIFKKQLDENGNEIGADVLDKTVDLEDLRKVRNHLKSDLTNWTKESDLHQKEYSQAYRNGSTANDLDWNHKTVSNKSLQSIENVSKLLNIPENQVLKSLGDKADVIVIAKDGDDEREYRVSTKTDFKNSGASIFTSGSRSSEVDFIGSAPSGMSKENIRKAVAQANSGEYLEHMSERERDEYNSYSDDAKRLRWLKSQGFSFDGKNSMIRSDVFRKSLSDLEHETKSDVTAGLEAMAWETVNRKTTNTIDSTMPQLPERLKDGFLEYSAARGSVMDPSKPYDPNEKRIELFAVVDDKDHDDIKTHLVHMDRDGYKNYIQEYGSIGCSNYKRMTSTKNGKKVVTGSDKLAEIEVLDDGSVLLPVNLSCGINRRSRSERQSKQAVSSLRLHESNSSILVEQQSDEFICSSCFLVKNKRQLAEQGPDGPICKDCAE